MLIVVYEYIMTLVINEHCDLGGVKIWRNKYNKSKGMQYGNSLLAKFFIEQKVKNVF